MEVNTLFAKVGPTGSLQVSSMLEVNAALLAKVGPSSQYPNMLEVNMLFAKVDSSSQYPLRWRSTRSSPRLVLLHSTGICYDGSQRSHHQGWSYFTVPVSAMMEVNALFAKVGPTSQYPLS